MREAAGHKLLAASFWLLAASLGFKLQGNEFNHAISNVTLC